MRPVATTAMGRPMAATITRSARTRSASLSRVEDRMSKGGALSLYATLSGSTASILATSVEPQRDS